ncbi:MAG: hypothetical protein RLZZ387_2908 [Chloroflexota bacterium]|jgi:hypothetical protein
MIDTPPRGAADGGLAAARVGWYAGLLTSATTAVTFGFAITALPNSGAGCAEGCLAYPYLDSLAEFPRDYLWMPPAIMLCLVYVAFMASIHASAAPERKIYSQIGLSFALMSAITLAGTYFVQLTVVPASLLHGETEGIALLTQYNPRGVFIALEELGYLLMSLSFLCVAPVFTGAGRAAAALRWVFAGGFALAALALIGFLGAYGLDREDRLEVALISIDWLVLLVSGVLASLVFRARLALRRGAPAAPTLGATGA